MCTFTTSALAVVPQSTDSANSLPVFDGLPDASNSDLPDEFYVTGCSSPEDISVYSYADDLLVSYVQFKYNNGSYSISNQQYRRYTYLNGYTYVDHYVKQDQFYWNGTAYDVTREYSFY